MTRHIMIDLETMDTGSFAAITSIGACAFDIAQKKVLLPAWYGNVHLQSSINYGGTVGGDTVMWWMQQAEKARLDLLVNQVSLELALQKLASWMRQWGAVDKKFRTVLPVWGNGSDFDNVILGNAFKACRMDPPWAYSNNRCFRTLKELAKARGDVVKPVFQGTAHNALDDAIYQAQCVIEASKVMEIG